MAPFGSLFGAALLLASSASAHFLMTVPTPLGTDDDNEPSGPCGGYTPDFSKNTVSDFHVGGSNVGMRLAHPQATWLFRATLDQTGQKNWTQLFPTVTQSGLGDFCERSIPAPESWVGKMGLIGVVGKAVDGLLYSCAAVKFVSGSQSSVSGNCKNGSAQAQFNGQEADLAKLASPMSADNNGTGAGSAGSSNSGGGSGSDDSKPKNGAGTLAPTLLSVAAVVGLGFVYVV